MPIAARDSPVRTIPRNRLRGGGIAPGDRRLTVGVATEQSSAATARDVWDCRSAGRRRASSALSMSPRRRHGACNVPDAPTSRTTALRQVTPLQRHRQLSEGCGPPARWRTPRAWVVCVRCPRGFRYCTSRIRTAGAPAIDRCPSGYVACARGACRDAKATQGSAP